MTIAVKTSCKRLIVKRQELIFDNSSTDKSRARWFMKRGDEPSPPIRGSGFNLHSFAKSSDHNQITVDTRNSISKSYVYNRKDGDHFMKFTESGSHLMQNVFGYRVSPEIKSQPAKYGVPLIEGDENWALAQELVRIGVAVLFKRGDGSWNLRASFLEKDGGEREYWKP